MLAVNEIRPNARLARFSASAIVAIFFVLPITAAAKDDARSEDVPLTAEATEFFEKRIRPLLVERCYDCHGPDLDEPEGGLRLDSRDGWMAGGGTGPAIAPGDVERSLLIKAVRYTDPLVQMPPDERLSSREIEALVEWVRLGAPDPRVGPNRDDVRESQPAGNVAHEALNWWSFHPVADPAVPPVVDISWPSDEIDRFILARLEAAAMRPAPPADKRTLIRRATFDLTGLPPTPGEIDSFLSDDSPRAFVRVIERLLASPAYGERWGRHWLDVVRYADTSGCNGDFPMPEAYRYRNYVIDSFNADKPYDEFLREQIAGDLLPAGSDEERYEQIVATGYLAISRRFSSLGEEFHLTLDDTVDNLGKAVLALSISCARCHAHKFDPIPQEDYYALYGIFASTKYAFPGTEIYRHPQDLVPLVPQDRMNDDVRPYLDEMAALDEEIFRVYSKAAELDTGKEKNALKDQWKKMQGERDALVKKLPDFPMAYAASEGTPVAAHVHLKGDPKNLGAEVPRGFLHALGGQTVPDDESGSGRRELAEWLTEESNPLTTRVIVNRVWLHHFGQGLVRTPDDFGTRGAKPTHPELLDWLVRRFQEDGQSIKSLHRRIMLSRTYQMACVENAAYARQDPDNELHWRFTRRRLDAEEIRDSLLAVAGTLDRTQGGPHPFPPIWDWRYTQHRPFVDDYASNRRSVYLMQQRIRQQPYLGTFDGADTNAVTGLRKASTTPQQALFMLNSKLLHVQAARFADRLFDDAGEPQERVARAYQLAFGRPPTAGEVADATVYLEQVVAPLESAGGKKQADRQRSAWASYLRVLLSSNEFMFVE